MNEATEPKATDATPPASDDSKNYFQSPTLMQPPVNRAAFSDRQAWLIAELSRLAYFPFEGGHQIDKFIEVVKEVVDNDALFENIEKVASKYLGIYNISPAAAEQAFESILKAHKFDLVGVFNKGNTQGFAARRGQEAYLLYRGTESFGDVKDDLNANLVVGTLKDLKGNDVTAEVHEGFWEQFKEVDSEVRDLLKKVEDCRLNIGGHSLGGALANLATRYYADDSAGSTYTFGAPAVSPPNFQDNIKTPIYRIVNARDPVPLLPNPALMLSLGVIWRFVRRYLGFLGTDHQKAISKKLRDSARMRQIGYPSRIVYIGRQPKLRYSFGIFQRFALWLDEPWLRGSLEERFVSHHKMKRYSEALRNWGEHRSG